MTFSEAELTDIRIALQDRAGRLNDVQWRQTDRNNGVEDDGIAIEQDRISAILERLRKAA